MRKIHEESRSPEVRTELRSVELNALPPIQRPSPVRVRKRCDMRIGSLPVKVAGELRARDYVIACQRPPNLAFAVPKFRSAALPSPWRDQSIFGMGCGMWQ